MKTAVIDIGSSFVKAALIDTAEGTVVEEKKMPAPAKRENADPLLFEIGADSYVQILRDMLEEYTDKYPDTDSLLISTQMHGFIYRTEGMDPVYVSWQDMRCLHEKESGRTWLDDLHTIFPKEEMRSQGVDIKPSLGLCNLYTLLAEHPEVPRDGELYTLGSYLIYALTGKNICHATNAAPLGLLDVEKKCFSERILRKAGFERMHLPQLAESDVQCCGTCCFHGREIRVYPDFGDQQTAIMGSAIREGEGFINIATAAQVGSVRSDFVPGNYEIRPYFNGQYLYVISNMPAGRGLDVLADFLKDTVRKLTGAELTTAQFWTGAAQYFREDPEGIQVDMSFYPQPAKLDGGEIRGIFSYNLNLGTLISAAFTDMARTYRKNLEILSEGGRLSGLVCAGGVSWKQPELVRKIAAETGLPCRLSVSDDEAMEGLFHLALMCRGGDDRNRHLRNGKSEILSADAERTGSRSASASGKVREKEKW